MDHNWNTSSYCQKRRWCSGNISDFHSEAPVSITGRRIPIFLFIIYIMPKSRRRRRRKKRRRRGAGTYGRRDAWDNVARRIRVSDDAAAAARRRTRRMAGRNVDPYRRREWMQGPRGHGRRWIARHAAAAGRAHQRHKTRADRRVLRKTGASGGTRRRRRR